MSISTGHKAHQHLAKQDRPQDELASKCITNLHCTGTTFILASAARNGCLLELWGEGLLQA